MDLSVWVTGDHENYRKVVFNYADAGTGGKRPTLRFRGVPEVALPDISGIAVIWTLLEHCGRPQTEASGLLRRVWPRSRRQRQGLRAAVMPVECDRYAWR